MKKIHRLMKGKASQNRPKESTFKDPAILDLAARVAGKRDPEADAVYPRAYPATLVATTKDGRTFQAHVDYPKGDPENPASGEEIVEKFHRLTERRFEKPRREKIIEKVGKLETLDNIATLGDLIR